MALANAGFTVEAVCPSDHPLRKTNAVQRRYVYEGLTPLRCLADSIAATNPDLIVPGDDRATQHLHDLYRREEHHGKSRSKICVLIERSLGPKESFPFVFERSAFIELAQEEGVRVPKTEVVEKTDDLRRWGVQNGFPAVLKANGTFGGNGVRVVRTIEEAEDALRALQAPPILARAAKRALLDRDTTLVWPSLFRRRFVVNAQDFVAGREATSTIACWKGNVLAGLYFDVVNKRHSVGPATVLRLSENTEMCAAVEKMVRRLNLSGLYGFDFMLEEQTEEAYLIEINPRSTQVGHLTLGPGRDLPAALYAAVTSKVMQEAPKVTENNTIALFPQEWLRNPTSSFLRSGYHDVPWQEPALVRACIRSRGGNSAWYSQQRWIEAFSAFRVPRS
jgi:hypothetical protein